MKKLFWMSLTLFLVVGINGIVGCDDDKDNEKTSIVGTWDCYFEDSGELESESFGYIVFNVDGTFEAYEDGYHCTGNYSNFNEKISFSNVSDSYFDILTWYILSASENRVRVYTPEDEDCFWLIRRQQ